MLVIRLSALGDVAIMVPVLEAYAQANPDVRFTVAAPPLLEPLFSGMPNVAFLGVKKKQSARAIYRQLRAVGADAVADLHQVNRVGMALTLLRLDALCHLRRLRFRRIHKGRLSRWLFLRHLCMRPRKTQDRRYAEVFDRLGLASRGGHLPPGHRPPTAAEPLPRAVGIAPFAQHRGKIWPWEHTCSLALTLAAEGIQVHLFGSRDEATQLESLAAQHGNIVSLAGRQSFAEELEIIRSLPLMVTMDSANMHFASAVGTPVVSIWGATHPDFGFRGYGQDPADALCAGLACQPCSAFGQKPCRHGDYRCLRAVTPAQVADKVRTRLDG
ncbi:MAG: glycosyltransferase family 9 protein, partial [Bacteroidales bacterium]|nr:glycosyltransferase family 9 protein [Bacteroidales bacterium]